MDMLCPLRLQRFAMPAMEQGDLVPLFEKLPNDERSDEARPAQYEDVSHTLDRMRNREVSLRATTAARRAVG